MRSRTGRAALQRLQKRAEAWSWSKAPGGLAGLRVGGFMLTAKL